MDALSFDILPRIFSYTANSAASFVLVSNANAVLFHLLYRYGQFLEMESAARRHPHASSERMLDVLISKGAVLSRFEDLSWKIVRSLFSRSAEIYGSLESGERNACAIFRAARQVRDLRFRATRSTEETRMMLKIQRKTLAFAEARTFYLIPQDFDAFYVAVLVEDGHPEMREDCPRHHAAFASMTALLLVYIPGLTTTLTRNGYSFNVFTTPSVFLAHLLLIQQYLLASGLDISELVQEIIDIGLLKLGEDDFRLLLCDVEIGPPSSWKGVICSLGRLQLPFDSVELVCQHVADVGNLPTGNAWLECFIRRIAFAVEAADALPCARRVLSAVNSLVLDHGPPNEMELLGTLVVDKSFVRLCEHCLRL